MPNQPKPLKKGDQVAIICPAGIIERNRIEKAAEILRGWGLQVVIGKTVGAKHFNFAGSDQMRADEFQFYLDDEHIKAIICARGGYGTARMMDLISFENFIEQPKWIVGYSDVTALHNHINQNFEIHTIHSVMPSEFLSGFRESTNSLKATLFGKEMRYQFKKHSFNRPGGVTGRLVGGNLSIVHSMLASRSQINTDQCILFLEDVGERLYNIDRMLVTLKRAGMLSNLSGLLVGGFTGSTGYEDFGKTAFEIVHEHCSPFGYPMAFHFPAGHQDDNRALVFGKDVHLTIGAQCYLDFR